jgi:hypothetical protein
MYEVPITPPTTHLPRIKQIYHFSIPGKLRDVVIQLILIREPGIRNNPTETTNFSEVTTRYC